MNRVPEKWDMESDVVVIGYGAAGAVAAITAHDHGARVLLLEKMSEGGGNSRVCGGNIIVPQSIEFAKYLKTLSFATTSPEIIENFVEQAMKNGEWIKEMGGDISVFTPLRVAYPSTVAKASFPQVPGSDQMVKYNVKGTEADGPPAERLFKFLSGNVERRGIKVLTGTPARELFRNEKGEIIGLLAEREGKKVPIQAKRAVILTCGGFEHDEALKWDNLPPKPVYAHGNPGNTGDGLKMAQKIGAALWHMTSLSCTIGFKAPEYEASFHISFLSPAFIFIDKHGQRFADETGIEVHEFWRMLSLFDTHRIEFPRIPLYAIFGEEVRKRGPINSGTSGYNRLLYKWSLDNSQEIAKGWILKAQSLAELAGRIAMDPSVLENTFKKYDESCKAGKDADFRRAKEKLRAVDGPPYYAIQLWPCLLNTQGGPKRDGESRVLDPDGQPIPRLYAAGELGSIWGYLYQGANNIGECIVFGKIAGQNAAAEKPWS